VTQNPTSWLGQPKTGFDNYGLVWLGLPWLSGQEHGFDIVVKPGAGLTWLSNLNSLGLVTLCRYTVDQDKIHYRLAQWIFQALEAWDGPMLSFHIKFNYHFALWLKKIEDFFFGISIFFIGSFVIKHLSPW